ncbi:T9SS type A sorting domain-containing protein [Dyadobacter sp. 3J3]|uniref:T9SS type A sorting domain-containing protein n=1 Tax=Dyadobacter sp. 3J3 TaxID=2606600 RepID=UPI00135BF79C|nr:T9SS type A sorting domain-containing protein [Dyadobacter sp. 3J3]
MKKFSIIILLISVCFRVSAQCPPAGNITLSSQAEVNNFQTLYGSCTNLVVNGDLTITGSDISSLLPLAGLKEVTGYMSIEDAEELTALTGLESLEVVGDGLFIAGNDKLVSLAALAKLTSVTGYLSIRSNLLLTSLQGLHNITSVGGELEFVENSKLINLDGLAKLKTVGGYLAILRNGKLTDISGLVALTTVNGEIAINGNNELVNPGTLSELTGTVLGLRITDNAKMKSLPVFPKLGEVYGYIVIEQCPELKSLAGLPAGKSLYILVINENASLTNLSELGKLGEIIEDIEITNNQSLIDISGLSALISVGGEMKISGNHALETPGTLAEFTGGGELRIINNSKLKYLPVFPKRVNFSGDVTIEACPQLISLEGLSNLETVGGDLVVEANSLLPNLSGLGKLVLVGGDLGIDDNASLTDISGLTALISVVDYFDISDNPKLVTMGTLPEFTGDGDHIYFYNNAKMKSLPSFPKLVSFSGYITIQQCPELVSLAGLSALKTLTGNLRILDNASLGTCAIDAVCSLLNVDPGLAWIANNATGCNNIGEVQEACEAALPVTLVSFSGKMNTEGFATLAWSTSSETNSDYFVIEHRSIAGAQWTEVGKVTAKRESSSLATYDFLDTRPASGENLYRLKMVDADQTYAYSRIISLRNKELTDLFAYPNPFTNKLHFSGSGVAQISVFDASGTLRFKRNLTDKNEVDLKNLIPGKYLLKVQTTDGRLHTRSVVKD